MEDKIPNDKSNTAANYDELLDINYIKKKENAFETINEIEDSINNHE